MPIGAGRASKGSGRGYAKVTTPKKTPVAKAKGAPAVKGLVEDHGGTSTGSGHQASTDAGSQVQEALLAEAAKILKGVSLKACRLSEAVPAAETDDNVELDLGWLVSAVASASDPSYALVDSGATNALRPAKEGEISAARVIQVDLASGAAELHISKQGTLLSLNPCQVILPAGYLVQLGYGISWKRKGCVIQKAGQAPLEVKVVKGCPLIPREVGLNILDEYEAMRESGELVALKRVVGEAGPSQEQLRHWLAHKVARGRLSERDQLQWLRAAFPELPQQVLSRVVDGDADAYTPSLQGVPWNRSKRRFIARAGKMSVLVHLFSGNHRWKAPAPVLEVEKSKGADLLEKGVWQHLMGWAISGVVGGIVAGPPCRTVGACRSETDGGPPPVRGRGDHRWGLSGLPGHLGELAVKDSVLWMRTVLLYAVAQAVADVQLWGPGTDSCSKMGGSPPIFSPPTGLQDPVSLAKWALSVASSRLVDRTSALPCSTSLLGGAVFFVWEHPRDPKEFMPQDKEPSSGWASWWSFPEWQWFRDAYGIREAVFDQGKLGHPRPKPTTLATNSWFLYEALHARFLTPEERKTFVAGPESVSSRVQVSATWALWAPGLTGLVLKAWLAWGKEKGLWPEIRDRQQYLAKLTQEEQLRRHVHHVPFRKGCPICVAAQGRQRSHWRAAFKGIYAVSADIAGPFKPGRCRDPVASGRDKGLGYKYFLATAFTLPLQRRVSPFSASSPEEHKRIPAAEQEIGHPSAGVLEPDLPDMSDLFGPTDEEDMVLESADNVPAVRVVDRRYRSKKPEPAPDEPPPLPPPSTQPPLQGYRTLFMGIPLRSRRGKEVLAAVQKVVIQLEAYGFPVHRFHADRAKELRSADLVSWLRHRGLHCTWTPGESPAGNKAELAVQNLKGVTRKLLATAALPHEFWPFAVLHASNRNWVSLAEQLGAPSLALLPFGMRLQARKRMKRAEMTSWASRTVEARYLGHAPSTPGGHLVWVCDDKLGPKVLLTNTVYPVGSSSADAVRPKRRLTSKTAPEFVVKAVAATPLLCHFGASQPLVIPGMSRLVPGGEWEAGEAGEAGEEEVVCDLANFVEVCEVQAGSTLSGAAGLRRDIRYRVQGCAL